MARRFSWPRSEVLVAALQARNFPADLTEVPLEDLEAVFGPGARFQLLAAGSAGRRRRSDVRALLAERVPLGRLEALQRQLRERLRARPALAARADDIELVAEGVASLASLPPCQRGAVVVDTDALSLLFKGHTRGAGLAEVLERQTRRLVASQTAAELHAWVMLRGFDAESVRRLEDLLAPYEVVYPDELTSVVWAVMMNYCDAHGRPGGAQDMWVAATALRHGAHLCTANAKDYDYLPWLQLLPWHPPPGLSSIDANAPAELPGKCSRAPKEAGVPSEDSQAGALTPGGIGRFRWPREEILVSSVVVQNFEPGLSRVPVEVIEVFGTTAELMPGGQTGRRDRTDVRVELRSKLLVGDLSALQVKLRGCLAAAGVARVDAIEAVPEIVSFASLVSPTGSAVLADAGVLMSLLKGNGGSDGLRSALARKERKFIALQSAAELQALVMQRCLREERICKMESLLADYELAYPDELTGLIWGALMNYCRARAQPSDARVVWVAATALRHGACICTESKEAYAYLPWVEFLEHAQQ